MAQERRRHQGQKQTDNHFWVMVHMDLGDAEVGRFGLFQSCLRAAMGTPHASSHWNFPGAGETPEQLLAAPSEWRSVQRLLLLALAQTCAAHLHLHQRVCTKFK